MEVKVEVKRYAQDVSIVNWYRPFLLPLLLPLLLPFLLPNYHLSFIIYHLAQRPANLYLSRQRELHAHPKVCRRRRIRRL